MSTKALKNQYFFKYFTIKKREFKQKYCKKYKKMQHSAQLIK